jgi:hypothetical protein
VKHKNQKYTPQIAAVVNVWFAFLKLINMKTISYHDRQDSVACKKQCQPRDTLCLFNTTQSITFQHIASKNFNRIAIRLIFIKIRLS